MIIINKYLKIILISIISINYISSQEVTQADYEKYLYRIDYNNIKEQMLQRRMILMELKKIGKRNYVAYFAFVGGSRVESTPFDLNHLDNVMSFEDFIPYEKKRKIEYRARVAKEEAEAQKKLAEKKIREDKLKSEYIKSIDSLNTYSFLLQVPLNMILGSFEGIDKKTYKVNYEQDNSFNDYGFVLRQRSNSLSGNYFEAKYDLGQAQNSLISYELKILNIHNDSSRKFFINDCQVDNSFFNKTSVKSFEPEKNFENWSEEELKMKLKSTSKKNKEYKKYILDGKFYNKDFTLNSENNNGFFKACASLNELTKKNIKLQIDQTSGLINPAKTLENLSYDIYKNLILNSLLTAFSELSNNDEWANYFKPYLTEFFDNYYFPQLKSQMEDFEIDKKEYLDNILFIQDALINSDTNNKSIFSNKNLPIQITQIGSTKKTSSFFCILKPSFAVDSYIKKFPTISNGRDSEVYSIFPFYIEFSTKKNENKVRFYKAKYSNFLEIWEQDKKNVILTTNFVKAS